MVKREKEFKVLKSSSTVIRLSFGRSNKKAESTHNNATNEGITIQVYEKTEQLELGLSQARQQSPLLMMRDKMNELNGQIESLRISSKRSTIEQKDLLKKKQESIKILENEDMELRVDLKKFIE
ncbi:hypothetical protein BY996DRAFT_6457605 [Phakopsora pachyrhizi]|uniref:Uncharacterized protein n=1 Tax=Phakopsora pachyrhizi TaxID=170000 RepID=A0AAV0BDR6_PHAPC|nr:hypothetical protein BY996DRAFT_6457605 [Phakopsora pachyrhizi]CAH7684605.1 hypothetical protein PPACK8108_LOCUS18898 [Phakopsora pachyrhizi]